MSIYISYNDAFEKGFTLVLINQKVGYKTDILTCVGKKVGLNRWLSEGSLCCETGLNRRLRGVKEPLGVDTIRLVITGEVIRTVT